MPGMCLCPSYATLLYQKTAIDNMPMNGCGSVSIKLFLQIEARDWMWPLGHGLPHSLVWVLLSSFLHLFTRRILSLHVCGWVTGSRRTHPLEWEGRLYFHSKPSWDGVGEVAKPSWHVFPCQSCGVGGQLQGAPWHQLLRWISAPKGKTGMPAYLP